VRTAVTPTAYAAEVFVFERFGAPSVL